MNEFYKKILTVLKNGWAGNEQEKNYWLELVEESKQGDIDALSQLKAEFKFNSAFKKETGIFKNI